MIVTSKEKLPNKERAYLFLAGSMNNNSTNNWRNKIIKILGNSFNYLDPTNSNHDKLDKQQMKTHVEWELNAMEMADIILLNFLPKALSPISLVELGMYVASKKLIVVCPKEFYKSSYVNTLCEKYNTPIFLKMDDAINLIKNKRTI